MALRSLLARTTTALWRAPSSAGHVVGAVPRMSPASSSRRYYTSQGDYDRNLEIKELERLFTKSLRQFREDVIRESGSEKIWGLGPAGVALGFGACTAVGLGAGFTVGFVCGVLVSVDAMVHVLAKKKSDESTDEEIV